MSMVTTFNFNIKYLCLLVSAAVNQLGMFRSSSSLFNFRVGSLIFLILTVILLLSGFAFVQPL